MKTAKHFLTTMFILMIARMAGAQTQVGVTAGIGGATQSCFGDIYNNDDLTTGFNAGITVRKPVNETFAVKTRLLYALKGCSYEKMADGLFTRETDKLNYLVLPVEAEYSIPVQKNRLFTAAGPYAGFLLDAKHKTGKSTKEVNETKNVDFGLAFEIGYAYKCRGNNELQFSVDYEMGLAKISDYNEDWRNKTLSFNVAVLF
jgi:hypothetical protein